MQSLKRLVLLFLGWAFLACGEGRSDDFCRDNADCETRLTCFQNQCLLLEQIPEGLVWEVMPPGHARPMTMPTPQRTQPIPLSYCESRARGNTGKLGPMRVDIEGEKRGLPGKCVAEQQWIEGDFSFPLSPGRWRLTFHPQGSPPIVRVVDVGGCQPVPLGTLRTPESSVLRFLPVHGKELPQPRCGIRAQAFDLTGHRPLSRPVEIGLAEDGTCSPPQPDGWAIQVAKPEEGSFALVLETATPAAPVIRQRRLLVAWMPEAMEPRVISTESRAAERTLLDLLDPDGLPVDGARIRAAWPEGGAKKGCLASKFEGFDDEFGAFRSALATPTGLPGTYELWLPPGPYHFEVIPPAATDLAAKRWEEKTTVREGGGNVLPLRLDRKAVIEGSVRMELSRNPLADAWVQALPLSPFQRAWETHTDAQGAYRLQVDPGPYLLLADPPGRNRSRIWSIVEVAEAERARVDLGLSQPRVVAGEVRRKEDGGVLGFTLVRAWDVNGTVPVMAGEAVTDQSGRFVLRLRR